MRYMLMLTLGLVGGYILHGKREQTVENLVEKFVGPAAALFLGPEKE